MSTDQNWEKWGRQDPYFGVITDPKFRNQNLSEEAKKEFFKTGEDHIVKVFRLIESFVLPNFAPANALDFGCGTGRLLLPLAKRIPQVVGMDISESMLEEANKNCLEHQVHNASLYKSDDHLSALNGLKFDLVHTVIVLQHIPVKRVREIFKHLLDALNAKGVGVIQITYGEAKFEESYGEIPKSFSNSVEHAILSFKNWVKTFIPNAKDPEMQMNNHNLNHLFFLLQKAGVKKFYSEFTNHNGHLGLVIYFQKLG